MPNKYIEGFGKLLQAQEKIASSDCIVEVSTHDVQKSQTDENSGNG